MKKKIILFMTVVLFTLGMLYMPVKADSGWDSDYDSGGWDSGGSDWSYDSDSDWSYTSGSYDGYGGGISPYSIVIALVIIIIIIIIVSISKNNNGSGGSSSSINNTKSNNYKEIDEEKITSIDPSINISEFRIKAFNIYRDIQTSWMNFDTDTIRKLTTDEIYNMYSSQLETLKLKKQKNIMSDIKLEEAKVIDIRKEDDVITLNVYMRVNCYDYVINEATSKVVRGTDRNKISIEYILSFVKSASNDKSIEKCPNCGAPVDIVSSAKCPYCDSTLVKDASDYVLSKKTSIGQRIVK